MALIPSRGKLPLKGVFRDSLLRKNPDGFSPDVMAMVVNKVEGTFNSEPGNDQVSNIAITNNLSIIGIKSLVDGSKILMSINNNTGLDEIGLLDVNYNYVAKVQQALGFNVNYPFHPNNLQVEYDFQNNLILAFSDNLNSPKIINLTTPPSPFNLEQIQLFPNLTNVQVVSNVIENGGSLPAGTYYPAFKYRNNDGTETACGAVNNPVYIVPSNGTVLNSYQGSAGGVSTTKSLQFTLTNVDTTYDKVVLMIIYVSNGEKVAKEITSVNSASTVTLSYIGTENVTDVELAAVLVPPVYYNKIKHLTQVQGTLYGEGVTENAPINLQKYANLITLKFKSELTNALSLQNSYKVNAQNNQKKGYCHGEVYGLYLIAKLKQGGWTQVVHIPGRVATTIQNGLTSANIPAITGNETDLNTTLLSQDSSLSTDIAIDGGSKYFQIRDTTRDLDAGTFTGTLGYWENQDEVYPNTDDFNSSAIGGLDLRGQKVRHHRFPSIKRCKDSFYSTNTEYGKSQLDALSIVITSFPTIPDNILSQIEGFQILYAERSYANMTVAGNDLALTGGARQGDPTSTVLTNPVYTSSGNWSNRQSGSHGSDINNEYIIPNGYFFRLHSFNLLLNKPAINPAYLANQFVLNYNNISTAHTIQKDGTQFAFNLDYTDNSDATVSSIQYADEMRFAINNYKYIPNNVLDGQVNNYRAEECIFAQLTNGNYRLGFGDNNMDLTIPGSSGTTLTTEQTYWTSIMLYRKNLYSSFYSQSLASTGVYWTVGNLPSQIYGGDTFINIYGFVTYSPRLLRDIPNSQLPYSGPIDPTAGVKVIRAYVCESTDNIGFRYEVIGDPTTNYYPFENISSQLAWFLTMPITTNPNNIAYSKDFSRINNLNPFVPLNPFTVFQADHPFRIIRSTITANAEKVLSWRTFLANDFFELQKDKGKVTNIQGINDELLIQTETTILKTRANEVLNTSGINAYVGSGDIFSRIPIELKTDIQGSGGCQNKFSCLLTPFGYFFVDVNARKVFLVTPNLELKEITDGMYIFFLDNLRTLGDNPFLNTGITVAYDAQYERIVLCQLDINPFVWSYTPEKQTWTSRHPYLPSYLFNDRTGFYSLKGQILYKHNSPTNRCNFYGTIYPSWVVIVFRELPPKRDPYEPRDIQASGIDLAFYGINWKTEILINGIKQRDLTINKLLIWDSYQSTGDITILPFNSKGNIQQTYNARKIKERWVFNKFRDLVQDNTQPFIQDYSSVEANINHNKDATQKKRFCDDYLAVKFLFSNQLISNLQPDCFLTDAEVEHNPITR